MANAPGARPWQLLAPRGTGLLNRWRKASRQEKVGYAIFGGFALAFWAFSSRIFSCSYWASSVPFTRLSNTVSSFL